MATPRKSEWKQENPRDQIRTLLGAANGNVSNLLEGVGDIKACLYRVQSFLDQAEALLKTMPEGSWE